MFIITYFLSQFGQAVVAAYGVATRIEQIVLLPALGLNIAVLTLAAQNSGAGRFDRVRQATRTALRYGGYIMIFGTAPIAEAKIIKHVTEYEVSRVLSSNTEILESTWFDRSPPKGGFYMIRIIQSDGNMAWAGPIWVK